MVPPADGCVSWYTPPDQWFTFEALCNLVAEDWMLASQASQHGCEAVVNSHC